MNLSQILNPPGSSSSTSSSTATVPLAPPNINNNSNSNTTHRLGQGHGYGQSHGHGHGYGRTSSSPTPQPPFPNNNNNNSNSNTSRPSSTVTSPTAVLSPVPIASAHGGLRWATDNLSNGSPQQTPTTTLTPTGSSSRKHANSVSVAQLEESASTFSHPSSANTPPQRKSNSSSTAVGHNVSTQKSKSHNSSSSSNSNSNNEINNNSNGLSHSGSLTFRAYDPQNQFKDVAFASSPTQSVAATSGQSPLHMNHSTPQDMSTSTAKKKPRNQASATAEAAYQDSFQGMVTDPSDAKPGPRKTTTKKTTGSSPPRAIEGDIQQQPQQQQQRDFKFVVEGQDKAKATKPVAFEVLPPFQVKSPAQTQSPSQDTPGEECLDQDAPESSPTPDFERNADGKFRCSWPRCGKEFTVASRLTTHFRIHSGKPPYLCGYKDCQKAFHTSSSLSHHRVVHTDQGLRPYICHHNRCGATYTQLARLITHQRTTHSGMILFIPQESSSSTSSPQTQSQAASATTTPSGNTPDDPFASSPSQTPVPSGYESTPVSVSAAGLSLESNNLTPRPSTPVGLNDSNRISTETHVEDRDMDKDRDKAKSGSKKDKGAVAGRTAVASVPQSIVPSKRSMVEQQRSHTVSPTPLITPALTSTHAHGNSNNLNNNNNTNNASASGSLRTVSSKGYYSDDPSRSMGGHDRARESRQDHESRQELDASGDDDETDEMRMRREAALTMASFKDLVRVEQPQPHHQQQQQMPSSGPAPAPPSGYYGPQQQQQQQHGGQSYPNNNNNSDYGQSSHMYPPPPPQNHHPSAGHHHVSYPPPPPPPPQQQLRQQTSNKHWNDDDSRGGPSTTGPPPQPSTQTEVSNGGYHQQPPSASSASSAPSSMSRVMVMNSSSSMMNNSQDQHSNHRRIGGPTSPFDALYAAAAGSKTGYFTPADDLDEESPRNLFRESHHDTSALFSSHAQPRGPQGPTPHYPGQR